MSHLCATWLAALVVVLGVEPRVVRADLPHVKVFDRAGQLVLEQSSAPGKLQALLAAIREAVTEAVVDPVTTPPPPAR
jgi:hypothetical protein